MRDIILLATQQDTPPGSEEMDILGEILDDLEDIHEDWDNLKNGNRFCFQWKAS